MLGSQSHRALAFVAVLLLVAPLVVAQVAPTGIRGTVLDPAGFGINNAPLRLTGGPDGSERQAASTVGGGYSFSDLAPGTYSLTVAIAGFAPATYDKIVVEAGRTVELKVQLKLGRPTANIDVLAALPEGTTYRRIEPTGDPATTRAGLPFELEVPLCDLFPNGVLLVFGPGGVTWKMPGLQRKPEAVASSAKEQK
jgi:hypothetical protein